MQVRLFCRDLLWSQYAATHHRLDSHQSHMYGATGNLNLVFLHQWSCAIFCYYNLKYIKRHSCKGNLRHVVLSELLHDLTENLVLEEFGLHRSLEDLIGQLINRASSFGWIIAHVLHDGCNEGLRIDNKMQ